MNESFVGAAQRLEHGLGGGAVVGIGGVDHRIGSARSIGQHGQIIKRAHQRCDAQCLHARGAGLAAHQTGHLMPGLEQSHGDSTADITGCTGNKYVHVLSLHLV